MVLLDNIEFPIIKIIIMIILLGRLAMLSIAGMAYQAALTGNAILIQSIS